MLFRSRYKCRIRQVHFAKRKIYIQKAASSNAPKGRKNVRKDSGVGRNIIDANNAVTFQK